eukprot:3837653-Heterocapsa_arctica.AAC.1
MHDVSHWLTGALADQHPSSVQPLSGTGYNARKHGQVNVTTRSSDAAARARHHADGRKYDLNIRMNVLEADNVVRQFDSYQRIVSIGVHNRAEHHAVIHTA